MISHKHRFIFVHISKTAGCSIEAAFGIDHKFINPEQPDDERHRRLGEYQCLYPEAFDQYFKFAFVRNPWDRTVSKYSNLRENKAQKLARINSTILAARSESQENELTELEQKREQLAVSGYFKPFKQWVAEDLRMGNQLQEKRFDGARRYKVDMEPCFDFIGRFENLHRDFEAICDRIGIGASLPHVNRSKHAHYTSYYDDESRAIVATRFAHDIERFGYRFGD